MKSISDEYQNLIYADMRIVSFFGNVQIFLSITHDFKMFQTESDLFKFHVFERCREFQGFFPNYNLFSSLNMGMFAFSVHVLFFLKYLL